MTQTEKRLPPRRKPERRFCRICNPPRPAYSVVWTDLNYHEHHLEQERNPVTFSFGEDMVFTISTTRGHELNEAIAGIRPVHSLFSARLPTLNELDGCQL